jgi:hypothetical protein
MKRYIAKKDEWFKEGTEAFLVADMQSDFGLFSGIRINQGESKLCAIGEEYLDEEMCSFDEFDTIEVTQEDIEFSEYFGKHMDALRASDAPMGSLKELQDFIKGLPGDSDEKTS